MSLALLIPVPFVLVGPSSFSHWVHPALPPQFEEVEEDEYGPEPTDADAPGYSSPEVDVSPATAAEPFTEYGGGFDEYTYAIITGEPIPAEHAYAEHSVLPASLTPEQRNRILNMLSNPLCPRSLKLHGFLNLNAFSEKAAAQFITRVHCAMHTEVAKTTSTAA